MTQISKLAIYIVILMLSLVVISSCSFNDDDYYLENRTWDVCLKNDFLGMDKECTYLITYVFDKDGTGYEYAKSAPDSIQKIQSQKKFSWKLKDDLFTVNVKLQNGERTIQHKIHWIDKSSFYTTETNSIDVTTETYYHARD